MYFGVEYKWLYISCLIMSILASAISRCASEGEKIMFTKDWIVVLSKREEGNTLSSNFKKWRFLNNHYFKDRNASITVIGHLASLITSIFASYLIVYLGYLMASLIVVSLNLISWIIEKFLLSSLYNEVVELHTRKG